MTNRETLNDKSKPAPLFLLNTEIVQRQAFTETSETNAKAVSTVSPEPDVIPMTTTKKIQPPNRSIKSASIGRYQCQNCQKSYEDKRNYDIHRLYCRS